MARNGFAEFLIARRAELRPSDVGMPEGGRRRTPGLRREEVAVRAGVSADYLARLEQGRDTNPSVAVIDALADALLLRGDDRRYFSMLALASGNESRCPGSESAEERLAPTIETILHALHPTPAFVVGRRLNVLGWNQAWADFVAPLGLLDGPDQPNLARYTFMHPAARRRPAQLGAGRRRLHRRARLRQTALAGRRHAAGDDRGGGGQPPVRRRAGTPRKCGPRGGGGGPRPTPGPAGGGVGGGR
ncbi:helix-turn-helix domain-containing protein, partial [Nocardia abscessus]|uniref:helix-turn-helix domain-containing protein n=1 Tax=Nocardia abscessus TaxID=120957 RepID=UPI0024583EA0